MPNCGGNWNNTSNAGVFNRNFNNNRSKSNNAYGFRCIDHFSNNINTLHIKESFNKDLNIDNNGEIGIVFPSESEKSAKVDTDKYYQPTYEDIYNEDNLYEGYLNARKGKRNRKAIYDFEKDLFSELETLKQELINETYTPSKYRTFKIYEPKERVIVAPTFRDSIVQHTIYKLIYDIFDRGFIYDSYGCRIGKGVHKASDKLQKGMRKHSGDSFYLQMDVEKYYYNIDHEILEESISRKIKDKRLVNLIMKFVNTKDKKGLFVGNLLSQLFGLIYMDRYDHFVKRTLKHKHYVRYVDDFVLIGLTKEQAIKYLKETKTFLKHNLKLELSKHRISKIKKGCNFVGYRTWRSKKFIRKRSLYHFSKFLRKGNYEAVISLLGHAKFSSSINYLKRLIYNHDLDKYNDLKKKGII